MSKTHCEVATNCFRFCFFLKPTAIILQQQTPTYIELLVSTFHLALVLFFF